MKTQKDIIRTVDSIHRCLKSISELINEVQMRDGLKVSKQLDSELLYHAGRLLARLSDDCLLAGKELSAIEGAVVFTERPACNFTSSGLLIAT